MGEKKVKKTQAKERCPWIGRIMLKCLLYSKQSLDLLQSLPQAFFTKISFKICMEPQKTWKSQSNLEKEGQSWKHHASWFQTILQSYNSQNSMIDIKRDTKMNGKI